MLEDLFKNNVFWFVIGIFVTLLATLISSILTKLISNKELFVKNVTEERGKWRDHLREDTAIFSELVVESCQNGNTAHIHEIEQYRTKIQLRLNPKESYYAIDSRVTRSMSHIVQALHNSDYRMARRELHKARSRIQKILKGEWDKSKTEAVTGKLAKASQKTIDNNYFIVGTTKSIWFWVIFAISPILLWYHTSLGSTAIWCWAWLAAWAFFINSKSDELTRGLVFIVSSVFIAIAGKAIIGTSEHKEVVDMVQNIILLISGGVGGNFMAAALLKK